MVLIFWWPGFHINQLAIELAKIISGLILIIKNMKNPVIPW